MRPTANYISREQLKEIGLSEYEITKIVKTCRRMAIENGAIPTYGKIDADIFNRLYPQYKTTRGGSDERD